MIGRDSIGHVLEAVPPSAGAAVMGTGIVSIDLSLDGREDLSRALLAIAAVVWAALGLIVLDRLLLDRPRLSRETRQPAALTAVAGTAVLGMRITPLGWEPVPAALLALAVAAWCVLVPRVLRHWETPTVGTSFNLAVGTESLAALVAVIAVKQHSHWLAVASLVPLATGLAAYGFVFERFDLRRLLTGSGDHWVAGGALAIATLACGRVTETVADLSTPRGAHGALEAGSLVLWGAAIVWLPALVACEVRRPRLAYSGRRWSTVFPLGMYAACSFIVGQAAGVDALVDFARVWTWVAFAGWATVGAGLLRHGLEVHRAETRARTRAADAAD